MNVLARAAEDVMRQGIALLHSLGDAEYSTILPPPYEASVGRHYRHILDHFLCLSAGARTGEIDYDRRERDSKIESDPHYAIAVTESLIQAVNHFSYEILSRPCTVHYSVGYGDGDPAGLVSVVERELAFCVGHAVHHYALIKLICNELGVQAGGEFGIAPSTLKYHSTKAA